MSSSHINLFAIPMKNAYMYQALADAYGLHPWQAIFPTVALRLKGGCLAVLDLLWLSEKAAALRNATLISLRQLGLGRIAECFDSVSVPTAR